MSSETVVFLFSDIEGSTVRWETKPGPMRAAVRRHDDLVRAEMEAHNGHVFKTVGDAFCVAFSSARDALQAALDTQRTLNAEDWSAVDGLRVRMALHAGEAEQRNGDYFGPAVNRVARLLSTANGAQVVVSGAVADLTDQVPAGLSLRALGTFHLKDLERSERIYQLVAPDLPSHFKPLHTLDAVPNNLPIQSTAFIGRESDVVQVRKLLTESTLVTIAGTGGVGKTRIALQCAADAIDRMADGAWFVNFAPLTDSALVTSTILTSLSVAPSNGAAAHETLVGHLKTRELLIVLDNCEHVIDQTARIVAAIREQCPRVTILATSREVLHLDGEAVYRLPPLDVADSIRLFAQRAQSASPAFAVTATSTPALEEICRHLDGIPLAIELAAARLRTLSLEELLRRLSERFRILTGGTRTALPRQQTLRALIDWSYDLLGEDERALFRRVAVFNGGFTLAAAGEVCSDGALDEWTILDLLSSLVDKSLVVADAEQTHRRYHLLESIQEYARQKLNEQHSQSEHEVGEALRLAERHARYFARAACESYAQFDTRPPENWLGGLRPELDNFRAALGWAIDRSGDLSLAAELAGCTGPLFLRLSLLDEGVAWCTRAGASGADLPAATRARVEYVLSMLYNNQGKYDAALPCAQRAVTLYGQAGDSRGLTRALSQAAQLNARAGRFEVAKPLAGRAIERARTTGDALLLASVLRRCAFALPPAEIEVQARSQFSEAVEVLQSVRETQEACLVMQWWAEAEANAECFERALKIAKNTLECADSDTRMYLLSNIAGYALAAGNFAEAGAYADEALKLAVEARHPFAIAMGVAYVAAQRAESDAPEAARLFGYSGAQMDKLQWSGYRADRLARENILADLERRLGMQTLNPLLNEGAAWSQDQALERALAT